jgi:2'-5' RNA ligase
MNKTRRLFIGLPLSDALRKRLVLEMDALPQIALLPIAKDNLQVTLMFLGFVHDEDVPEMCQRVGEVAQRVEPFELSFTAIKLVESAENPKMITLVGEPSDGLRLLREEMEKAFSAFVTERKSYSPTVTVAKIKKNKWLALDPQPTLKEKLSILEMIDTVVVYESLSLEGKRRYEPIDTFPLL